ncbi:GNAT family N-acetyltransferase [Hoeflea sp. YIM 152468]|uniref:GNAT family N-acetyltransferase n=1 Tax=Hoeflea sp. YIM 152468 TaxID=3031759 RepID=UPI0023DBA919|nr:GNAT family N-acetyltransferase [Hoeflea sp. YIM 152468]MDF1606909.1 GNAT family N-acetyltransferase [Hoeflea sp. YIM 152468]
MPVYQRAERMGLRFRPVTAGDLGFLAALYASTRTDELALLPWSDAQKTAFLDMQFEAQHSHYLKHYPDALWLVLERAGKPVGRLYLDQWPDEHRIIDIALLPQARGQGMGAALLRDLMDDAAEASKAVGIHVEKANPAMRLYKRLGFETIADKGVYDLLRWQPLERRSSKPPGGECLKDR